MPADPDGLDALRRATGGDGPACLHATAVAIGEAGLLLLGAPGAGKSGTAAQLVASGATLVADDLVLVSPGGSGPVLSAPPDGPSAMELRGFGIVAVPARGPVPLRAALLLGPGRERLPDRETVPVFGAPIPLVRHPASADLAAKLRLWVASLR